MAASLTTTPNIPQVAPNFNAMVGPSIRTYTLAWTSASDGSVAIATSMPIVGELLRVAFSPGAGGTQPSDAYDVTITDTIGVDILAGQGGNLSNSTKTHVRPGVPFKDGTTTSTASIALADVLTLNVTNAGSGKTGTIVLYVR